MNFPPVVTCGGRQNMVQYNDVIQVVIDERYENEKTAFHQT